MFWETFSKGISKHSPLKQLQLRISSFSLWSIVGFEPINNRFAKNNRCNLEHLDVSHFHFYTNIHERLKKKGNLPMTRWSFLFFGVIYANSGKVLFLITRKFAIFFFCRIGQEIDCKWRKQLHKITKTFCLWYIIRNWLVTNFGHLRFSSGHQNQTFK